MKRPANWESTLRNESTNARVNVAEVLLTAIKTSIANYVCVNEAKTANKSSLIMSIPFYADILADRDMRIANSSAALHNIFRSAGLQNATQLLDTNSATVGTGARAGATKVENIKGSKCSKYGNAMIQNASLQDTIIVPESKFKLLSILVFLKKDCR